MKKTIKNLSRLPVLAIGNVLAFVAVLVINYLAVTLPIGGMTTGALSDLYPNLFTPAGITFSIRGIIYSFLGAFTIWQLIDLYKKQSHFITKKIGIWFLLSCVMNISWIFAWQFQQVFLSVVIMLAFLGVLMVIAGKVQLGEKIGTWKDKLLVQVPFSLYLGRLSVATIANISAWLVHIGWSGFGLSEITRTIIVILIATVLTLRNLYKKYNIIFALVVLRAFLGIIFKRLAVDPIYTVSIIWTTGMCMMAIAIGIGARFELWRKN